MQKINFNGGVENGTEISFHLSKGNNDKDLLFLGFQDIKLHLLKSMTFILNSNSTIDCLIWFQSLVWHELMGSSYLSAI